MVKKVIETMSGKSLGEVTKELGMPHSDESVRGGAPNVTRLYDTLKAESQWRFQEHQNVAWRSKTVTTATFSVDDVYAITIFFDPATHDVVGHDENDAWWGVNSEHLAVSEMRTMPAEVMKLAQQDTSDK